MAVAFPWLIHFEQAAAQHFSPGFADSAQVWHAVAQDMLNVAKYRKKNGKKGGKKVWQEQATRVA
jgi:hypothetical protein